MPVVWAQVKRGLDPLQFTIHNVPELLKRSKAWADYREAERPPLEAIARLARRSRLVRAA
jgi:bifunctional non-homologous end joining protein LigD